MGPGFSKPNVLGCFFSVNRKLSENSHGEALKTAGFVDDFPFQIGLFFRFQPLFFFSAIILDTGNFSVFLFVVLVRRSPCSRTLHKLLQVREVGKWSWNSWFSATPPPTKNNKRIQFKTQRGTLVSNQKHQWHFLNQQFVLFFNLETQLCLSIWGVLRKKNPSWRQNLRLEKNQGFRSFRSKGVEGRLIHPPKSKRQVYPWNMMLVGRISVFFWGSSTRPNFAKIGRQDRESWILYMDHPKNPATLFGRNWTSRVYYILYITLSETNSKSTWKWMTED